MTDLIPRVPLRLGRKQSVTAKAWIIRRDSKSEFVSKVSLGKGRCSNRQTETRNRGKALEYNRLHLIELLMKSKPMPAAARAEQMDLLKDPSA